MAYQNPFGSDPRFKQGFTKRGKNARGSALTAPPQQARPNPFASGGVFGGQQPQPQGVAQPPPPPQPNVAPSAGLPPQLTSLLPQGGMGAMGGAPNPNMKAIIDAMMGARVHKGMDGKQLGMGGVDPNLKYALYAMRGRRHKGMQGQDIY